MGSAIGGILGFFVFFWILFGVIGGLIMQSKGQSGCGGFALGFILGPIGLLIALVMPKDHRELETRALSQGGVKKCPRCAEVIKVEATRCRFCGTDLPPHWG